MEYEYSYKVSLLDPYIDIIKKENKFISRNKEIITIYRKKGYIARISIINDEIYLDFKEDKLLKSDLIERKESKKVKIDSLENCESILNILDFKKSNILKRYRTIYESNNIKFEIDEYIEPEKSYVFSFEGNKNICDLYHSKFIDLNKKYKLEK